MIIEDKFTRCAKLFTEICKIPQDLAQTYHTDFSGGVLIVSKGFYSI